MFVWVNQDQEGCGQCNEEYNTTAGEATATLTVFHRYTQARIVYKEHLVTSCTPI